jgi:hypothetical protein
MTVDLTVEDLEHSLSIPSFEEELALSDLPRKLPEGATKDARLVRCRTCGTQVWVGPYDIFKCPKEHDIEDDNVNSDDTSDDESNEN